MTPVKLGRWRPRSDFLDFNLKCLFYLGLWPDHTWSGLRKHLYRIYENSLFILAFIYIIITGIGAYTNRGDTIVLLTNLDKNIAGYNFVSKITIFYIKRDSIRRLITDIVYSGDNITEERKRLMMYHIIIICMIITTAMGGFQMIAQMEGEMVIDAWFPFDPMRNSFTLFLAGQILGVLFVPCIYRAISIQGLVCSVIMYLCDQLVELQERLKALNYSVENESCMRNEFKEIIKKHIRLMGYYKSLKEIAQEYFLVQNLAVTAELCLNALMVSLIGLDQIKVLVTFVAFLIIALMNAYIFCRLGNELMDQSSGLALAAYECIWTSWPVDMQKNLLILITAAQKNFALSAGGMAFMSMQTFAQALYNGYSMFAVLSDVVD